MSSPEVAKQLGGLSSIGQQRLTTFSNFVSLSGRLSLICSHIDYNNYVDDEDENYHGSNRNKNNENIVNNKNNNSNVNEDEDQYESKNKKNSKKYANKIKNYSENTVEIYEEE
jgi:hypothetical protein